MIFPDSSNIWVIPILFPNKPKDTIFFSKKYLYIY
jgi:hypothetical protein